MNSHINPHWIVVDIEPSIALARAQCFEMLREQPAYKPRVRNLMKDARIARSMYQRELLRQFVKFLVSRLRFARASRSYGVSYPSDLQPSASLAQPRGA